MNFVRTKDEGTDPDWPDHTGVTTWQWKRYTIEEHRMGGITARREYKLYWGKKMKLLAICSLNKFNRRWVESQIQEHEASRNKSKGGSKTRD